MNSHQPQEREDQIDLLVFVKIIWDRKIIISLLTLVLAISSVLYALSIPNIFESRVVLAPSSSSESTNINLSGTAGALARVAGIDLGGGGSSKGPNLTLAIEKITSRKFATDFVINNSYQPELLASENWNSSENKIIYNKSSYDSLKDELKYNPRDIDIYKGYLSGLSIRFDKRTKFTHISFKHFSPYFAKDLLDQLVLTINEDIKNTEVEAANESIKFLEDQMTKTNISDIRFIFTKLIEKNIKTILLAEVSPEYVFEILDPAFVPDLRSSPSRGVLCILITAFGFLFIAIFFIIIDYRKLNK
tara:strand:+ start:203 stop:1114 length:912 start_codon:yes stop_codon:yes gene_type:complete